MTSCLGNCSVVVQKCPCKNFTICLVLHMLCVGRAGLWTGDKENFSLSLSLSEVAFLIIFFSWMLWRGEEGRPGCEMTGLPPGHEMVKKSTREQINFFKAS